MTTGDQGNPIPSEDDRDTGAVKTTAAARRLVTTPICMTIRVSDPEDLISSPWNRHNV